ncbi:Uncharacterized protein FWK35_00024472 [Aphis craccivora]|uniref:Uncharacterized protein n=1 Tax=Aphis craccivora TaxID=307492 RepID=A0A6G0Z435_APHCR|nr:Uncharacterized protein FWK35_00024472 [Aphis craccivora]
MRSRRRTGRTGSVPAAAFVDLRVLDEMGLLPERLLAHLTPERFFARVRAQVNLDVALVQEPAIAYVTVVHGPFPGHVAVRTVYHGAPGGDSSTAAAAAAAASSSTAALGLAAPVPRLFGGHVRPLAGRGGVREFR